MESPLAQDNDGSGSVDNGGGSEEDTGGRGMRVPLPSIVDVVVGGRGDVADDEDDRP